MNLILHLGLSIVRQAGRHPTGPTADAVSAATADHLLALTLADRGPIDDDRLVGHLHERSLKIHRHLGFKVRLLRAGHAVEVLALTHQGRHVERPTVTCKPNALFATRKIQKVLTGRSLQLKGRLEVLELRNHFLLRIFAMGKAHAGVPPGNIVPGLGPAPHGLFCNGKKPHECCLLIDS